MSATALTISIYYALTSLALILLFAFWFVTRKKEDDIWRWILSIIGSLVFTTIFWISYWIGTFGAWQLILVFIVGVIVWLWLFFSHSSKEVLDKVVFSTFGAISMGMIMFGGYTAGERGWWAMAIPFYFVGLQMLHHMFEPD